MPEPVHVVTGAFGYSGRWIAKELLSRGKRVRTLTNAKGRHDPFHGRVEVLPIDFSDHKSLVSSLKDADVLYNTYWVRYKDRKGGYAHEIAVENIRRLFLAAEEAGVKRVVHFSVAHPHKAPDWSYFRGKVEVEKILTESNLSYAILRPTVFFGGERDVLINNMSWLIRKIPRFRNFRNWQLPNPTYPYRGCGKGGGRSGRECRKLSFGCCRARDLCLQGICNSNCKINWCKEIDHTHPANYWLVFRQVGRSNFTG